MAWLPALTGLGCILLSLATPAAELTPEQRQWLESDSLEPPQFQVNLGELEFLAEPPDRTPPHSDNSFLIDRQSLETGWLTLRQCHSNLDPVPALEVVYEYKQLRHLQIIEQRNIDQARVEGKSVQMAGVNRNNRLCVEAAIRVLYPDGNRFRLINGPYHRQFLDGYYPYHVSLHILYPARWLQPVSIRPEAQPGFEVQQREGRIDIEAWFEGKLMTEIVFRPN